MPTIHAEVTAPTFQAEITRSRLTIELPERHMRVEITDDGEIRVTQENHDILNGAPSAPDFPRYAPGGEYEFRLPDQVEVSEICDTPVGSPDFDGGGSFSIAATHRH
jgi:hypothetical protein